jgi:protein TonB
MTRNLTVPLREMPPATLTAFALSVAAHIAAMLWFGPVSIRAPQPAAFETIEVALVSEPAPRPSLNAITRRLSQRPIAAPAPQTEAPEPAGTGPAPVEPAPGRDEPLVESRFNISSFNNPKPPYPLAARRRGQEGRVILRAHVREDGVASEVEIEQSSGYELLDNSARQTVQRWHFVPGARGNIAVASWVEIPIAFRLDD